MSDVPTHSAAWHYEQAELYLSLASFMREAPGPSGARAVNTYDQQLWATMALAHAQLASAGATVLRESHSPGRSELINHAEGRGARSPA